jgi:hypothetical protein
MKEQRDFNKGLGNINQKACILSNRDAGERPCMRTRGFLCKTAGDRSPCACECQGPLRILLSLLLSFCKGKSERLQLSLEGAQPGQETGLQAS